MHEMAPVNDDQNTLRVKQALQKFPRLRFGHLPTPLEPLDRLSDFLGGPRIWVKRDDCTGLALGGNKTRKLEFLIADALKRNADAVITQGAVQSNHVRQTAAAAAKHGLQCYLLLEDRTNSTDAQYNHNGNVLLDRLLGATIERRPANADMSAEMEELAKSLRMQGRSPYIIPGGGSNHIGALGYVDCAVELQEQADQSGVGIDGLVLATGSSGTQAGLIAGLSALRSNVHLLGIGVRAPRKIQEENVYNLARRTMDYLGLDVKINRDAARANCDYVGRGYGLPTEGMREAVAMLARLEGLIFDPVYSGKALHGFIEEIKKGYFDGMSDVVFLHTGGSAALFGYPDIFSPSD